MDVIQGARMGHKEDVRVLIGALHSWYVKSCLAEMTTWLRGRLGRAGRRLFRRGLPAAPARPLAGRAAAGGPRQQALRRGCAPQECPLSQDAKHEALGDSASERQGRPGEMRSLWPSHQQGVLLIEGWGDQHMHYWVQKLTGAAGGVQGYNIDFHVVLALMPCNCFSTVGPAAAALGRLPSLHELPAQGTAQRKAQQGSLPLTFVKQSHADA